MENTKATRERESSQERKEGSAIASSTTKERKRGTQRRFLLSPSTSSASSARGGSVHSKQRALRQRVLPPVSVVAHSRSSKMAGRSNHPMYQNGNASDDLESGDSNYTAMSTQQLERRREEDIARQDAMLDNIHVGVKGLKNHAHAINGEVLEQNEMIDDIDGVRWCVSLFVLHFGYLLCVVCTVSSEWIALNRISRDRKPRRAM